jgi:hypothetical protein
VLAISFLSIRPLIENEFTFCTEKTRSLRRPDSQRKKVSSCAISTGPSVASAAAIGTSASTLSMRAFTSMLRAIACIHSLPFRFQVCSGKGRDISARSLRSLSAVCHCFGTHRPDMVGTRIAARPPLHKKGRGSPRPFKQTPAALNSPRAAGRRGSRGSKGRATPRVRPRRRRRAPMRPH